IENIEQHIGMKYESNEDLMIIDNQIFKILKLLSNTQNFQTLQQMTTNDHLMICRNFLPVYIVSLS
ncbi:MAG: hypothetical protein KGY70_16995, partial [Bacteroidales bacterium]|nr:hypothetical protein [Bacteroidales bacterium]